MRFLWCFSKEYWKESIIWIEFISLQDRWLWVFKSTMLVLWVIIVLKVAVCCFHWEAASWNHSENIATHTHHTTKWANPCSMKYGKKIWPMFPSNRWVDCNYISQISVNNNTLISLTMYVFVKKNNINTMIPLQYCRMSKCDVCMRIKDLLEKNLTPEQLQYVLADKEEHLLRQQYVDFIKCFYYFRYATHIWPVFNII